MNAAQEPGRRQENTGDDYDLSFEESVAPELRTFKDWLPAPTPTDGQPYKRTRELRDKPPAPKPGRIHPRGIDSSSGGF